MIRMATDETRPQRGGGRDDPDQLAPLVAVERIGDLGLAHAPRPLPGGLDLLGELAADHFGFLGKLLRLLGEPLGLLADLFAEILLRGARRRRLPRGFRLRGVHLLRDVLRHDR
jgi:hypothetical protein